ncbi:MAG: glycosyltransferase [Acidobacteriota bacterium]
MHTTSPTHQLKPGGDAPFDADSTLYYLDSPRRRLFNHSVVLVGLAAYALYLGYRTCCTMNPATPIFSGLLLAAEIHGFFSLFFFFFQIWNRRGRTVPAPDPDVTVDVFITTYNEDADLLRQTIRGALAMRHPHRTFILDDGRRPHVRALAEELGCEYLTRSTNEHAKAGNFNNAFLQTSGTLVATFDADHVPRADFLERTIGFFRDPKVALVQVPQQYHNLDSLQHKIDHSTRRIYSEQDVFFELVCPGKDHWNAAFFCGTGAVLRRTALEPYGGLVVGSITEDMHTCLELHSAGWKSVYLNEMLVTGLAPMDFKTFQAQRLRWAEGNLKIIKSINPLTCPGLTLGQRICYIASMYHWTIGIPKMLFYLSPPWILFTHAFPIVNFGPTFLTIYAFFLVSLVLSYRILSRGTGRLFMDEFFNMVTAFTLIRATNRMLFGRMPAKFVVTDKRGSGRPSVAEALPHIALIVFSGLALEWGVLSLTYAVSDDWFGSGATMFWTLYNVALAGGAVRLALRPPQQRLSCRFDASLPVEVKWDGCPAAEVGITRNISDSGCALLWKTRLAKQTQGSLVLHIGNRQLRCRAEILSVRADAGSWVEHGVRFVDLPIADVDFINDAVFNMIVPRLFRHLSRPALSVRLLRYLVKTATRRFAARPNRVTASVPVRLEHARREWLVTSVDISHTGLGLVMPVELPAGASVHVTVFGAHGTWDRQATVIRTERVPCSTPSLQTWTTGLLLSAADLREAVDLEVAA